MVAHQIEEPEDRVIGQDEQGHKDDLPADGDDGQGVAELLLAGEHKGSCTERGGIGFRKGSPDWPLWAQGWTKISRHQRRV